MSCLPGSCRPGSLTVCTPAPSKADQATQLCYFPLLLPLWRLPWFLACLIMPPLLYHLWCVLLQGFDQPPHPSSLPAAAAPAGGGNCCCWSGWQPSESNSRCS